MTLFVRSFRIVKLNILTRFRLKNKEYERHGGNVKNFNTRNATQFDNCEFDSEAESGPSCANTGANNQLP